MLDSPPTDWDRMYLRIKFSPLGPDFSPERFLATPLRTLLWLIDEIIAYERNQHNIASIATAHLNTQVMWAVYGMGGGKGPKPQAKVQDFLPFPEGDKVRPVETTALLTELRSALRSALGTGDLPYDIFVALWRGPHS